jgi:murein DD-endopeptidase MepM/ murein hydrolase activator NlpD
VGPIGIGALPDITSLPDVRRRRRAQRPSKVHAFAVATRGEFERAATAAAAWRQALAAVDLATLAGVAPRMAPHCLVLLVAIAAVSAGGFARPDVGLTAPIGIEQGHLSSYARALLGPRASDVPVRDTFVRPALSTTTLSPSQPRAAISTYTVQPGDTVWDIGARFNVGAYSVLWSNGLEEDDIIKPGEQLRVPPVPGTLHTITESDTLDSIAKKYSVDPAAIVDFNGLKPGEALAPDRILVIPGGSLPILPKPVAPPVIRPVAPPVQTRPAAPAQPATRSQPQAPARPAAPVPAPIPAAPTGRLSWPTRGIITTYFSSWHPGIDIAAALGTPIGAADGGTVTFAGWDNTGYGYRVVMNHGNGYNTTYNHLSVISVRVGQSLGKGQQVGLMGSTGNSTGPHLHFEILRNGVYVNPLANLS